MVSSCCWGPEWETRAKRHSWTSSAFFDAEFRFPSLASRAGGRREWRILRLQAEPGRNAASASDLWSALREESADSGRFLRCTWSIPAWRHRQSLRPERVLGQQHAVHVLLECLFRGLAPISKLFCGKCGARSIPRPGACRQEGPSVIMGGALLLGVTGLAIFPDPRSL